MLVRSVRSFHTWRHRFPAIYTQYSNASSVAGWSKKRSFFNLNHDRRSSILLVETKHFRNACQPYSTVTEANPESLLMASQDPLATNALPVEEVVEPGQVPGINRYTCRTHNCGELTAAHTGECVVLCGWLQFQRMKKFFTLRDGYGETQVIVPVKMAETLDLESIPYETILKVKGQVQLRPEDMVNPRMDTGAIEVRLHSLEVLNMARSNLPMEVRGHNRAKESTRLQYRYMDLRFADMQRNLRTRSTMLMRMREYLIHEAGFVEVETPTLFRRTPGGAQEFVVPTRKAGHFYSLVQSPQQFKQMLMSGAVDRYFQVARCYRDESTRPDRQPEFTQLDIELSFTNKDSIMELIENLIAFCWPKGKDKKSERIIQTPFPRMTYDYAMEYYGCDKPDTRFEWLLNNVTPILPNPDKTDDFAAYAIRVPIDPKQMYPITLHENLKKIANDFSGCKFAVFRLNREPDTWATFNKVNNLSLDVVMELFRRLQAKRNETILLAYGPKEEAQKLLGRARIATIESLEEHKSVVPRCSNTFNFVWIVDFPMFAAPDEPHQPLQCVHHPFTAAHPDDEHLLTNPAEHLRIRSQAYDLVLNGQEVGGGSIRIHNAATQKRVLDTILHIEHHHLSHLIDALATGCPPHGGIALGLDRLLAIVCAANSIREVIAFPKGADGKDALSKAPVPIAKDELRMYHIQVQEDRGEKASRFD